MKLQDFKAICREYLVDMDRALENAKILNALKNLDGDAQQEQIIELLISEF